MAAHYQQHNQALKTGNNSNTSAACGCVCVGGCVFVCVLKLCVS